MNELVAADPQKQAEFLRRLCHDANLKELVTCEFDPTKRDEYARLFYGGERDYGTLAPSLRAQLAG